AFYILPKKESGMKKETLRKGYVILIIALILISFLPGGLLINVMDPWLFGFPFYVFVIYILVPLITILATVVYVIGTSEGV
ncbi:MAG: hypothetical protein QXN33_04375, partial [Candidatus Bathyarchaeia archaeon]